MGKKKETLEQVFKKAFYGHFKQHLSNSYFQKGKIVIKTLCGRTSAKFLVGAKTEPNELTCRNCLKVAEAKNPK